MDGLTNPDGNASQSVIGNRTETTALIASADLVAASVPLAVETSIAPVATLSPGPVETAFVPSDPNFASQWHLNNAATGINVMTGAFSVWDEYHGNGVLIGAVDDGVEWSHPDLVGNYRKDLDYDARDEDNDAFSSVSTGPVAAQDRHGTATSGIMVAANNGTGGVGVAFEADFTMFRVGFGAAGSSSDLEAALSRGQYVDVLNNSWGYNGYFSDTFFQTGILGQLADVGRDGLGTVIVFSAGNSGDTVNNPTGADNGNNVNYHAFQNSQYVIAVGALNQDGSAASFSTPGAAVLVSAPGVNITTTDRIGSLGYASGDVYTSFSGTSAAAPIVSGVVALMLEANPDLGYRDVQEILAYSARNPLSSNTGWQTNGASNWNGGGLTVNDKYGFGLVDAHAAVRLAENWDHVSTYDNRVIVSSGNLFPNTTIADNSTLVQTIAMTQGVDIDRVELRLNVSHSWVGDLVIDLTSPDGTTSRLVNRPGVTNATPNGTSQDNFYFDFDSVQFWGETGIGTWTLTIRDQVDHPSVTDTGQLNLVNFSLIGDALSNDDNYIYTDGWARYGVQADRSVITDTAGIDTLNFAAVTSNVIIDLTPGATNLLYGLPIALGASTVIENVFGGDGNDAIFGNDAVNLLRGKRGNDTLFGGLGNDTLYGGKGNDYVNGGSDNDFLDGDGGDDTVDGGAGNDSIYGDDGNDRLIGGMGDDWALFSGNRSAYAITLSGGLTTVSGLDGTDILSEIEHLRFADQDLSSWGVTLVQGTAGNDELNGTSGIDTLLGLAGNDLLYGSAGADVLDGGAGIDMANYWFTSVATGVTVDLGAGVGTGGDAAGDTLIGIEDLHGTFFGDTMTGDGQGNILHGASGNDTLSGGGGDDRLYGNEDNDTLDGGAGNDTLSGGPGNDRLIGGTGDDWALFSGSRSAYTIAVSGGLTTVTGTDGTDIVSEVEHLRFADVDLSDWSATVVQGTAGSDSLNGTAGVETLLGGAGNDVLYGSAGVDVLDGGAGIDMANYWFTSVAMGVTLDLGAGVGTGGDATGDTLIGIEDLHGTFFGDTMTGDGQANTLHGASGNDTLTGGGGDDRLYGNEDNDTLDGGAGNDTLSGGPGNDRLIGGAGDDWAVFSGNRSAYTITMVAGLTTIVGLDGTDLLSEIEHLRFADQDLSSWGATLVQGTAGNDELSGVSGNETLQGLAGNDVLYGSAGADVLDGGSGIDMVNYWFTSVAMGVTLDLGAGVGTGGDAQGDTLIGIEDLHGTFFGDTMTGDGQANILHGASGNDTLSGGGGDDRLYGNEDNDTLDGGAGNDTLSGGDGWDLLMGGAGADLLDGGAGTHDMANYWFSSVGVTVNLATGQGLGGDAQGDVLTGIEDLHGNVHDDTFIGDNAANTFHGATGNDTLSGGGGDDRLYGNENDDILDGGAGNDTQSGGEGNDLLYGSSGADVMDGGAGIDMASYWFSSVGVTVNLATGQGFGGDAQGDVLTGIEDLHGNVFNDTFIGDGAANTFHGAMGNDTLSGGGGDDRLYGNENNDLLTGGMGADRLAGGTGSDTFIYQSAAESATGVANRDVITDFNAMGGAEGDKISLFSGGNGSFAFLGDGSQAFHGTGTMEARFDDLGKILQVDSDGNGATDMEIELQGVSANDLDQNDFTVT